MAHPFTTTLSLEDLTAEYVRKQYLTGLTLCDDQDPPQDLPDSWYLNHLNNAIVKIEEITGVDILTRTNVKESHDYDIRDYVAFAFLQLHRKPTQSVQAVRMVYPTGQALQLWPTEWVRLDFTFSQVNLVATAGTFASILLGQGGDIAPYLFNGATRIPHTWEIDYVSGFPDHSVPRMVIEAICKLAVVDMLTIISDTVAPLGVTSGSLSIDGMSQSRSFQLPAFKARTDKYMNELGMPGAPQPSPDGLLSQIRRTYFGAMLASI